MHKAKNIYFLLIFKKKRDGPRPNRVPSPTKLYQEIYSDSDFASSFIDILWQHRSHIGSIGNKSK